MSLSNSHLQSLHEAIACGDLEKAKALLGDNPDLLLGKDFFDNDRTLLHKAVDKDYRAVAEFLLANGAHADGKDKHGHTALHGAATKGHQEVAKVLLANEADVNVKMSPAIRLCMVRRQTAIRT